MNREGGQIKTQKEEKRKHEKRRGNGRHRWYFPHRRIFFVQLFPHVCTVHDALIFLRCLCRLVYLHLLSLFSPHGFRFVLQWVKWNFHPVRNRRVIVSLLNLYFVITFFFENMLLMMMSITYCNMLLQELPSLHRRARHAPISPLPSPAPGPSRLGTIEYHGTATRGKLTTVCINTRTSSKWMIGTCTVQYIYALVDHDWSIDISYSVLRTATDNSIHYMLNIYLKPRRSRTKYAVD